MLVLLNFWRNHLVLCLENLLPSPLCWREKLCFHPCMLKTSSKNIPAYYCASYYRLRVHKIFTKYFLLLSIIICHKLCFREERMITANLFKLFHLNELKIHLLNWFFFIIQVIFSSVHPLHLLLYLLCIIYILCQQSLHTVIVNSHNTANRKSLTARSPHAFPRQFKLQRSACLSDCSACLSSVTRAGERQDDVLIKPHLSFVYDKPFCKDQLYTYRSGNRHSKERQANSFSIEWGRGFQPCSETHCLVNLF